MVEDRVTDSKRIAQLLASELSGRESGPLGDVSVVDADPDAEPAPDGALAYRVAVRGDRVGAVVVYPDGAAVELGTGAVTGPGVDSPGGDGDDTPVDVDAVVSRGRDAGLRARRDRDAAVLGVESGAAVKRAVDALVAGLSSADDR